MKLNFSKISPYFLKWIQKFGGGGSICSCKSKQLVVRLRFHASITRRYLHSKQDSFRKMSCITFGSLCIILITCCRKLAPQIAYKNAAIFLHGACSYLKIVEGCSAVQMTRWKFQQVLCTRKKKRNDETAKNKGRKKDFDLFGIAVKLEKQLHSM